MTRCVAIVVLLACAIACGSVESTAARCGDGIVQASEACDDHNRLDGDGCNTDCRRSGQLQWCYPIPATPTESVTIAATVAFEDGVIVAGERSAAGHERARAWVLGSDPDGAATWQLDDLLPEAAWVRVRALARSPDGATVLVLASLVPEPDALAEVWLGELALDSGALLSSRRYADPSTSLRPSALALAPTGPILAGSAGTRAWLASYDAHGALAWERRFDYDGGPDRVHRVVTLADGRIAAVGSATNGAPDPLDRGPTTNMFVRVFDPHGTLEHDIAPAHPLPVNDAIADAVAHRAGLLVAGSRGEVFPPSKLWSLDGDGELIELWQRSDRDRDRDRARFVEALASARAAVFVAGFEDQPSGPVARWLSRLDPQLRSHAWEFVGPPGQITSLSAATSEPALYAAVLIPRSLGGTDAEVCKFSE